MCEKLGNPDPSPKVKPIKLDVHALMFGLLPKGLMVDKVRKTGLCNQNGETCVDGG